MYSFKDLNGKEYPLTLTVGAFQRVKEKTSLSLDDLVAGDPPLLLRLDNDLSLFGSVLNALTGVTLDALSGAALGQARVAFWGALSDFFRDAGKTEMVKVIEMRPVITAKMNKKLDEAKIKLESPNTSSGSPA